MTALVLATVLATGPTLPVNDGIDQTAEARGEILEQILDHREYTEHMKDVWSRRRAEVIETTTANIPSYSATFQNDGWAYELLAVGFPPSVIPTMEYVIQRESGGDPNAVNGGGPAVAGGPACGLTQLFPCPGPQALDPMTNLRYAYAKYQAAGLSPWGM